jgi:hypothetical protein
MASRNIKTRSHYTNDDEGQQHDQNDREIAEHATSSSLHPEQTENNSSMFSFMNQMLNNQINMFKQLMDQQNEQQRLLILQQEKANKVMGQQQALLESITKLNPVDVKPILNNNPINVTANTLISNPPQTYDGNDGDKLFTWLIQAKHALKTMNDKHLVKRAITYLVDTAALFGAEYIEQNKNTSGWEDNWEAFTKAITQRFAAVDDPSLVRVAIQNIKFPGTAKVSKYINELETQFFKIPDMTDGEKIGRLFSPLPSSIKMRMTNNGQLKTYNDAKNKLQNICTQYEQHNQLQHHESKHTSRSTSKVNNMELQDNSDESETTELNQTNVQLPFKKKFFKRTFVPKRCARCKSKDHTDDKACTKPYVAYEDMSSDSKK